MLYTAMSPILRLRKVLGFNRVLGLTLPPELTHSLKVERGDYFEVYLKDEDTIIIKKHDVPPKRIDLDD